MRPIEKFTGFHFHGAFTLTLAPVLTACALASSTEFEHGRLVLSARSAPQKLLQSAWGVLVGFRLRDPLAVPAADRNLERYL